MRSSSTEIIVCQSTYLNQIDNIPSNTKMTTEPLGQICWLQVPCTSVPRAAAFYSSVLGWKCTGGNMGFFARFVDSEGNLQGIWAAK